MAMVRQHPTFPKFRVKSGKMLDFTGTNVVSQEEPTGNLDGANRTFYLANRPLKDSDEVYKDGMRMARGLDYVIDVATKKLIFSLDQIPQIQSVIRVDYKFVK